MTSKDSPAGAIGARLHARVASLMTAVALSACGGGGGSSSPPPPPPAPAPAPAPAPTPTLALKADAASVDAGAAGFGLHAILTGDSSPVSWGLDGPGTLSPGVGTDVTYTPPDADSLDADTTVTVTATVAGLSAQSLAIPVAAVDKPGRHWAIARHTARQFTDVAQGNGTFVAATFTNGLSRSTDGVNWTDTWVYPAPTAVRWGDPGWVAITNQGSAWFSVDAVDWTKAPDALPNSLVGVTYGNHVFVAYGGQQAAVSADGLHWTPVNESLSSVSFGNGQFMALRQNPANVFYDRHPAASTDGVTWHWTTDVANLNSLAFANGQFDADTSSQLWVTGDGLTWIGGDPGAAMQHGTLRAAGNVLFELDANDIGVQLPGATWQRITTGDVLSTPLAVASDGNRFIGVSREGWVMGSPDGLNWSTQVEGDYGQLSVIDFVDGQFVALSTLDHVMRSADGATWSAARLLGGPSTPFLFPLGIAHSGRTVVAVGEADAFRWGAGGTGGMWVRSIDGGATWAQVGTTPPAEPLLGVVHDGRRFVAITGSGQVLASPDGDAWGQIGTAPAPLPRYEGLAYAAGTYLAYGDGVVATSTDGVSWTAIDANALGMPTSHARVTSALWDGAQFVVAGYGFDGSNAATGSFTAVSADAAHWTAKSVPNEQSAMFLAHCGDESVLVGGARMYSGTDGLDWHAHALPSGASQLDAVACGNERFIGVGWSSAIVTSTR